MSAPGHCRHCWAGGDGCHIGSRDHGLAHSNWNDGHCPACDEAEAISQWCRDMAAAGTDADDYCLGTTNGLLAAVQHIARGRR